MSIVRPVKFLGILCTSGKLSAIPQFDFDMSKLVLGKLPTLEMQRSLILITDQNGLQNLKIRRDIRKHLYVIFPDCKRNIREAFYSRRTKKLREVRKETEEQKELAFDIFRAGLSKYCHVVKPEELDETDFLISQPIKNTLYVKLPSALGVEGYVPLNSYIEDYWKVFHNALIFRLIQLGAKRIEFHLSQELERVLGIKAKGKFEKYEASASFTSREAFKQAVKHIVELEKPPVSKHQVMPNFTKLDVSSSGAEILIDGFLAIRERVYGGKQKLVINIQKQIEKHLGINLFAWLLKVGGEWSSKKEEIFNCSIDVVFFSEEE